MITKRVADVAVKTVRNVDRYSEVACEEIEVLQYLNASDPSNKYTKPPALCSAFRFLQRHLLQDMLLHTLLLQLMRFPAFVVTVSRCCSGLSTTVMSALFLSYWGSAPLTL